MKLAVSHIAWPVEKDEMIFPRLVELGVEGIEVAPSKVWEDTANISFFQAEKFRRKIERYNLKIVGLHALFYDHPELGLFKGEEIESKTFAFLTGLGKVCSDLGGKTMVFGSGPNRRRGKLTEEESMEIAVNFFLKVADSIFKNEVFLCIESLGLDEADFINSAAQALELIKRVGHDGFLGQFDTKSLYAANEIEFPLFKEFKHILFHVHVNDPGLVVVGSTGLVAHERVGILLKKIHYDRYISIEQKTIDKNNPIDALIKSVRKVKECYL